VKISPESDSNVMHDNDSQDEQSDEPTISEFDRGPKQDGHLEMKGKRRNHAERSDSFFISSSGDDSPTPNPM
jgi:hypothetical protein